MNFNQKRFVKIVLIFAIIILASILSYYFIFPMKDKNLNIGYSDLKIGSVVDKDIQSIHPYPNSGQGTKLVWKYTLTHPEATSLKLHFKKIELKSYQKLTNKGETEVKNIIPTKGVDLDYGEEDMEKVLLSVWSGDYMIIRDSKQNIVAIIGGSCPHSDIGYEDQCVESVDGFWLPEPIKGETAIIELYSDEKENGFGIQIDKYAYGFNNKEIEKNKE